MTNRRTEWVTSALAPATPVWPFALLGVLCCASDGATQVVSPLARQVKTDAVTRVRDDSLGAGIVEGFLRFHNTGATTVRVVLSVCPFQLEAFRSETRQGVPAWVERRLCTLRPLSVTLQPDARDSVSSTVSVREILGDSLAAGRYYFAVHTSYRVVPDPTLVGSNDPPTPYVFPGGDAVLRQ